MSRRLSGRWGVASVLAMVCVQITAIGDLSAQNAPQSPEEAQSKETPQSQDAAASNEANPRIAQLIKDLDSDAFQTRQRASRELEKLGGQVIPEVTKALESASAEVQSRCLLLLTKCWGSRDEPTRQAAGRALKQLQDSKNPTVARFAKRLLVPPKSGGPPRNPLQILRGAGGRFGRAGGAVQGVARAQQGFTRRDSNGSIIKGQSSTDNNGVKSIHVEENGKTIDVKQNPQGAIKVKVTKSVDGKPQVTHYAADSEDELKKKHPEGHKTYKHVQSLFDKTRVQQLRAQQQLQQLRARGRGFARPNPATQARSLQQAQLQIDAALKQMRVLIKQAPLPNQEIQKQIEQIEAARNTLEELRKQLVVPTENLPSRTRLVPQAGEPRDGTKQR